jgi:hypothetical protein
VTFSNGNLSISGNTASTKNVRTTYGRNSGKWYWEETATGGDGTNHGGLGVADTVYGPGCGYVGGCSDSFGFGFGGDFYYSTWTGASPTGTPVTTIHPGPGSGITNGTVYNFALDASAGALWIGQGGSWYNSGNPASGTNPVVTGLGTTNPIYPMVTFYTSSPNSFTANFGASPFAHGVPAGFSSGFFRNVVDHGYQFALDSNGWGSNFLNAEPVTLTLPSTLLRFGLITGTQQAAGQYRMGLYTDNAGTPGTLLAQIPAAAAIPLHGTLEIAASQVALAPGNYWIAADFSIAGYATGDNTNTNTQPYYSLACCASALPGTWGGANTITNVQRYSYYIVVAQ